MQDRKRNFYQQPAALWILLASVIVLAFISEATNHRAKTTLTSGINLTDARIGSGKLLQLLTDAETAQRGYLLTGNPAYIEPLRNAQRDFDTSVGFLEFFSSVDPNGRQEAQRIRKLVADKFAELDRTVALAQAGDRKQALALVETNSGQKLMDELRALFQLRLAAAA